MQTIKDIQRPALRKPAGQGYNLSQKLNQTEVVKEVHQRRKKTAAYEPVEEIRLKILF